MPIRPIEELKSRFQNADHPDGADFVDLIDTLLAIPNNSVTAAKIPNNELPITKLLPGTPFQEPRVRGDGTAVEWFDATSNQIVITQTSHGFATGDVLTISGASLFVKAKADTFNTRQVVGMVLSSIDTNHFVLATGGLITGIPFTVTPGVWHYLSATTAGVLTTTAPSSGGEYVGAVLYGRTTSSGFLQISEAKSVVTGTGTFDPVYITPVTLATGNHASFTTLNIDSLVPALASTPFRFAILQAVGLANNDDTPQLLIRKDNVSPTYTMMYLRSNDDDGIESPDSGAHQFLQQVVTSPKTFDIRNSSSFSGGFTLSIVGYIP